MIISAIQTPWHGVTAKPQPDHPARLAAQQIPVRAVQPLPANPAGHVQPQWVAPPPKPPLSATKATMGEAAKAPMPDLHFPDPLPELPKIDPPVPKADYPAALGILTGSAQGKLG